MSPAATGSTPSGTAGHSNDAPAALAAFLRGVERRGAVLAELQAGDAGAGDAALAAAMRGFRDGVEAAPMADWPRRFWSQLLAEPGLHQRTRVAIPLDATDRLGELGHGPRAALLLRLAAGLSEPDAAAALGVAQPTYRLALQRALPHHADGRADPAAWQQLREQIHRRIKTLPPDRLVRLSSAREDVLRGIGPAAEAAPEPTTQDRPRWLVPLLWTLLVLCVLGLAATFWPWSAPGYGADPAGRVQVEPLPEPDSPASRYGEETASVTHRDFAMLADPATETAAKDLAFHSWLAAQQAAGIHVPTPPADVPVEENVAPSPMEHGIASETEAETADAP